MKAGWREATLAEVSSFINRGISPKYLENGGVAVLNQKCIRDHEVNFNLCRRHDAKDKLVSQDRFVRSGDVLVNSTGTGTLGRVAQILADPPEPTTVDSHVTIVRPAEGLFETSFFGYAMIFIEDQIQSAGEGCGGQTELARSKLANEFRVRFPIERAEQKRIVAMLDQSVEAIDIAQEKSERNVASAQELSASYIDTRLGKLSHRYLTKPLVELCEQERLISYGVIKLGAHIATGVPCLRTSNVRRLRIDTHGMKVISPALSAQYSRTVLKGGEVLVNVRGTLGGVAVVPSDMVGWNVSREVAVVPIDANRVSPEFVSYLIASTASQRWLAGMKKGAAYVGINIEDLRRLPITLPPRKDQEEIVADIEAVSAEVSRLTDCARKKAQLITTLRRSILQHAFGAAR